MANMSDFTCDFNSDEEDFFNQSSSSSSQDSDGEEMKLLLLLEPYLEKTKRNSMQNYFSEVVPKYTTKEFIKHFRVNKTVYEFLSHEYQTSTEYQNLKSNNKIKSAAFHLCVFLWFAGHEACSFNDLGDRFNISISTVHAIIKRVTYFVSELSEQYIVWPNEERREMAAKAFKEEKGIPNVVGCIDGTHIVIDPPREQKDEYMNRKGHYSIHMQGICDEKRKFIDIFIGYPGSVHDARVLKNSFIYNDLENLCQGKFLLGDSAYPCLKTLLTPFRDNGHLTPAEKNFNIALSSTRVIIEHTFGILKQRFRQLYYCKLKGVPYICHFIRACCILHNMADLTDLEIFEERASVSADDEPRNAEISENEPESDTAIGKILRREICRDLHNNRRVQ